MVSISISIEVKLTVNGLCVCVQQKFNKNEIRDRWLIEGFLRLRSISLFHRRTMKNGHLMINIPKITLLTL